MDPLAHISPLSTVTVYLADRRVHRGRITAISDGWMTLAGEHQRLVNLNQVVEIFIQDDSAADGELPRPTSKDAPVKLGAKAPARPWADEDLKALAHGFLDGEADTALASRFHRTRTQISILHQGFECARGNLTDDGINPAARTWVARWRKTLAG